MEHISDCYSGLINYLMLYVVGKVIGEKGCFAIFKTPSRIKERFDRNHY